MSDTPAATPPGNDPQSFPALIYRLAPSWEKAWPHLVWLLVLSLSTAAAWFGKPAPVIPPAMQSEIVETCPPYYNGGWQDDPEAVQKIVASLPIKSFAGTPAFQQTPIEDVPADVFLWQAYPKVIQKPAPAKDQGQVGCCVGFGTVNAIERSLINAIASGQPMTFKFLAEEATYAGSKVQVGGQHTRSDGSVGAWAAKFSQLYGVVSREKHGSYDLTTYSESLAKKWGYSGVPAELLTDAKTHPVKDVTQVTSLDEAKTALANGYGIAVCSGQGFSMVRDSRGVCRPQGSWAHCMCCDGYHRESDGSEFFHIENSWGADKFKGPVGWGNPSTAGFWCDARTFGRMVAAGDTWTFSSVAGWPKQQIDWPVRRLEPRRRIGLEPMFALAP